MRKYTTLENPESPVLWWLQNAELILSGDPQQMNPKQNSSASREMNAPPASGGERLAASLMGGR
jgi:hypothetical protein